MACKRIALRDFVIVRELELDLSGGFRADRRNRRRQVHPDRRAATGAGQPGRRRRGARRRARAEISAEFDSRPGPGAWLEEGGFDAGDTLLLRRTVDCRARAARWINGSPATATQLRELGDRLLDIHGQHAWQSLTRPEAVRGLLDAYAGVRTPALQRLARLAHGAEGAGRRALAQDSLQRERERLPGRSARSTSSRPAPTSGTS
jgi:DNA repair protein RecN (Recombination protein N)